MILKFVCGHLQFMGILDPSNGAPQDTMRFLLIHNCFIYISLGIFTIPTFCYCILLANTFPEFVNSVFFTLCGTLGISFQSVLLYGKSHIKQLVTDIGEIFNHRRMCLSFLVINKSMCIL